MIFGMCNYTDFNILNYVISQQNDILTQIATHLNSLANDHSELLSSIILGVVTIVITIYLGCQQNKISKKQHNLELFNKRWIAFEELKTLGTEAERFKHIFVEDIKNEETENFYEVSHKLKFLASKCEMLFDQEIKEGILRATTAFEKYHENRDLIGQWKKYFDKYISNGHKEQEYKDVVDQNPKLLGFMLKNFEDIYQEMLNFIKNTKLL